MRFLAIPCEWGKKASAWFWERPWLGTAIRSLLILLMVFAQWFQLDFSASGWRRIFARDPAVLLLNLAMVLFANVVLAFLTARWHTALAVTAVVFCALSITNYYVTLYHGSPFTVNELRNTATALNVLSGYQLELSRQVLFSCLVFAANMAGAYLLYLFRPARQRTKQRTMGLGVLTLAVAAFLGMALCGPKPIKPQRTIFFSWRDAIDEYGYLPCFLEDFVNGLTPYGKPEGYDPNALDEIPGEAAETHENARLPDLVLILNESFYDLHQYTDLEWNPDPLQHFYSMPNVIRGYAVVPGYGGGTNDSEYELLTSNSMYLLSGSAPFNYLNLTRANSIVRYLSGLGYETWALHSADGANYCRNRAYPELGFDHVHFADGFARHEIYGNRRETDAANYLDLQSFYESGGQGPRFLYLLTYQNHGGYDQNDASLDTVHVQGNCGELTAELNEYLTSISMSDEALAELLRYFETVDRPVVVCMLGDHAPSFLENLPARGDVTGDRVEIIRRGTPFLIWANYKLEARDAGYISLPGLVPLLLDTAGVPLSPYYRELLELGERLPVRTRYGTYQDAEGNFGVYGEHSPYYDVLSRYYFMEYNNLLGGAQRRQELFLPARQMNREG